MSDVCASSNVSVQIVDTIFSTWVPVLGDIVAASDANDTITAQRNIFKESQWHLEEFRHMECRLPTRRLCNWRPLYKA